MAPSRSFALLALLVFTCPFLPAQSDTPAPNAPLAPAKTEIAPDTPTFRTTVRRVIVDVVVRDSNNKPVHGLRSGHSSTECAPCTREDRDRSRHPYLPNHRAPRHCRRGGP